MAAWLLQQVRKQRNFPGNDFRRPAHAGKSKRYLVDAETRVKLRSSSAADNGHDRTEAPPYRLSFPLGIDPIDG